MSSKKGLEKKKNLKVIINFSNKPGAEERLHKAFEMLLDEKDKI